MEKMSVYAQQCVLIVWKIHLLVFIRKPSVYVDSFVQMIILTLNRFKAIVFSVAMHKEYLSSRFLIACQIDDSIDIVKSRIRFCDTSGFVTGKPSYACPHIYAHSEVIFFC